MSGEVITVSYDGGSEWGTKRQIAVVKLSAKTAYVREVGETVTKTYRLDRLRIVDETDESVEWKIDKKKRLLGVRVLPEQYFEGWSFDIHPALWAACGVRAGYFVNKDRTAEARARAEAEGKDRADVARVKVMERAYTHKPTPEADFHEGDVFWSRDRTHFLQVVAFKDAMEVHLCKPPAVEQIGVPRRRAYHLDESQLLNWLKTGIRPEAKRVPPALSYSEVLRLAIIDQADSENDPFN